MSNKKIFNILFCARSDLFLKVGGDTLHITNLQSLLKGNGHHVEIALNEFEFQVKQFDLIHFFNLSLVDHNYQIFCNAKKNHITTCFTPIFQNPKYYDSLFSYSQLIPYFILEKLKQTFYLLKNKISLNTYFKTIFHSHEQLKKMFLLQSDLIFCVSQQEVQELEKHHCVTVHPKTKIVIPTFEAKMIQSTQSEFVKQYHHHDYILVVGRIEKLKNQILILEALKETNQDIVFIGQANQNNKSYNLKFNQLIQQKNRAYFYSDLPRKLVLSAIKDANLVIQASCVENFGFVSLEAHYFQKKLIVSENSYFNSTLKSNYPQVNPYSKSSIKNAVNQLLTNKNYINPKRFCDPLEIERLFLSNTLNAYLKILS